MAGREPTIPPNQVTPVYRRPGFDFSMTGLVYASIMAFMGLAAVNLQASLLFGVFGLMIGIVLISGIISKLVLKRVSIRRLLPDQATVGRTTSIHYNVTNAKRVWASFSVTIAELDGAQSFRRQPQGYLLHAAPGQTAAITAEVIPKRRGMLRFDRYQLSTSFPFGFIKRAVIRRHEDRLLVFPPMARVDPKILSQFKSAEMTGNNLKPKPHGSDEFYGLRDYRPGESPRLIDWKRTARTGRIISREMTQVSPPRIVVVVDTYNPDGSATRANHIERSIAQAASLIDAALDSALAVGLVVKGERWSVMSANRGKRHKRELLTVLAMLPDAGSQHVDDAAAALGQASSIANQMTTLVLLTGGEHSNLNQAGRRGGGISIGAMSDVAKRWFDFDPSIDFDVAGPLTPAAPPRVGSFRGLFKHGFAGLGASGASDRTGRSIPPAARSPTMRS
jgi:uncharacterized protein (DUF58 family)